MPPALPNAHQPLAVEAELQAGPCRFVRERLRLPIGIEATFGWLRHPPSLLLVPRCGDGQLLLLRRYRPAVGLWVLEFPTGPLGPGEGPAEAGERLMRQLTGSPIKGWQELGVLRPNPGYSDERMTMVLVGTEVEDTDLREGGGSAGEGVEGELLRLEKTTPQALDTALMALDEPVDGRCVSAWFLARPHWSS